MTMDWIMVLPDWIRGVAVLAAMALAGLAVHALLHTAMRAAARLAPGLREVEHALITRSAKPLRILFPTAAARIGLELRPAGDLFRPAVEAALEYALDAVAILAVTWLFVRAAHAVEDVIFARADTSVSDNLEARVIRTRVVLLRQMTTAAVTVIGLGMVLLLHPGFRALGTGLLASAGIAGIVIGIAAQGPIRNLLAGVQVALTQPFRVQDVVIVENEWGQIEEITLTYVVVRIWDQRRLVVPIGYFLEKPFQNWTRTSADILGTALVHVDYTAPVPAIRAKVAEIAAASPHWDGRVCGLQVTDLKERTMELRALVSAADASAAWDLRCEVREKLIGFLQAEHPECLPRARATIDGQAV